MHNAYKPTRPRPDDIGGNEGGWVADAQRPVLRNGVDWDFVVT